MRGEIRRANIEVIMKFNLVTLLIAFGIAALGGYTLFVINTADADIPLANAIGGGIAFFVTLAGAISVSFNSGKGPTLNIRVLSSIFFAIVLVQQMVFCFVPFSMPPYIIITGILLLLYALIVYRSSRAI